MNYSPKLRAAMAEIEAVLKKNECVGMVHIADKNHREFSLAIDNEFAPWSFVKFERDGNLVTGMRITAKGIKEGTPEAENLECTVGFLCDFADFCNTWAQNFYQIKGALMQKMTIEHNPLTRDRVDNSDRNIQ